MTDDLLAWRKESPILARTVYLISNSLGAMPARTRDNLAAYAETWASRGVRACEEGWCEMPVRVADLIGAVIGAAQAEVVMQPNVSVWQCETWNEMRTGWMPHKARSLSTPPPSTTPKTVCGS
jgi:kynureninase